jgi:hypothetical protein
VNALTNLRPGTSSLSEMMQLSEMLAKSSMVPTAYRGKPQDVMVCLLWAAEVNLGAVQALNGIAVINGRPALWGDAALALVRGHPACAGISEGVEGEGDAMVGFCEVTRRGEAPQRRTFSVADAKKAKLWAKQGPWTDYPKRMLQMRARGFAIRDMFPDALRGVITAEEAMDYPTQQPRDVPNHAAGSQGAVMTALQAPEDTVLPLIGPDGTLYQIRRSGDRPAVLVWMAAARKAVAKIALDGAEALRMYRMEMGPHFAAISEVEPEAVKAIEDAISKQILALSPPEVDPDEPEDEDSQSAGEIPAEA